MWKHECKSFDIKTDSYVTRYDVGSTLLVFRFKTGEKSLLSIDLPTNTIHLPAGFSSMQWPGPMILRRAATFSSLFYMIYQLRNISFRNMFYFEIGLKFRQIQVLYQMKRMMMRVDSFQIGNFTCYTSLGASEYIINMYLTNAEQCVCFSFVMGIVGYFFFG